MMQQIHRDMKMTWLLGHGKHLQISIQINQNGWLNFL